jgi:isopenicillin N synthase-like dioxygenase
METTMATLAAKTITSDSLPVIDIAGLAGDFAARRAVAREIGDACRDTGFFYIRNHGVPQPLIDAALASAREFFALPLEQRLAVDKRHSRCNRGYEPIQSQTLEAGTPPDLKEGFYIGTETPADDRRVLAGKFNVGPNQWPSGLPGFRQAMNDYFDALLGLSVRLMGALALSLDLDEQYFADFCRPPTSAVLRLLHYPEQPANPKPDEKGCGAHTDFGGLTLLLQDDAGGLQVFKRDIGWIHAPPVPGTYVVNLGDMISRWTNDRYRSTLHRVVNLSGRDRYSVPFFFSGNQDHVVSCIPTCLEDGGHPHYPPTTVEGHLMEMYRRTYGR